MAAPMAAVAAVPHKTPLLSVPPGWGDSFRSPTDAIVVVVCSIGFGRKIDCNQSSVVVWVGVVRGVAIMTVVGVTCITGSMEPNTLTMAARVALGLVVGDAMKVRDVGVAEADLDDVGV